MKLYNLLLTWFLLITLLTPALLAEPCTAAFIPTNNITLERGGMTWEYEEQITDNESVIFRDFIDLQAGNGDNFVNAWEILKAETVLRNRMEKAIETKPDVKLNGTLEAIKVTDIDFWISKEALGKTKKSSAITNHATVTYNFEKEASQETEIWFMGTPNSNLTIRLPQGFDAEIIEGLNGKNPGFENNLTMLKGSFDSSGNITLWLSENESSGGELQEITENTEKAVENESKEVRNKTVAAEETTEARKSSGFFRNFLTQLHLSPKS
ncbi:MAG: hypothetical protein WB014_04140 [Methanosarcina sp.]